jgi:chromosome segregation ATPase
MMDWLQSKTTQFIALVSIIGTLAGFGYTGATYINRLENLESKIGGISDNESEVQIIEERFASIETSVEFLEKEIDGIEIPNVSDIQSQLAALEVQMQDFKEDINELKKEIKELESNKNPLLN